MLDKLNYYSKQVVNLVGTTSGCSTSHRH